MNLDCPDSLSHVVIVFIRTLQQCSFRLDIGHTKPYQDAFLVSKNGQYFELSFEAR